MADGIAARFNGVEYDASDDRALDAVLLHPAGATTPRAGRRPGPGFDISIGGTPEQVTVSPGGGVITDPAGGGGYRFVLPTAVSKPLGTRPTSGTSRIDVVIARIYNNDVHPETLLKEVDIEIVAGTAAASPVAPTIPTDALRLCQLGVPATGAVTVSKLAPRMAAAGGILTVVDGAERDAITPLYDGLMIYREDTDTYQGRVNGAWANVVTDSGWVDVAATAASGFSVQSCRYKILAGSMIWLELKFTRTGADLTFNGVGNLTDTQIASGLPSAIQPPTTQMLNLRQPALMFGSAKVLTDGTVWVTDGYPTAAVTGSMTVTGFYPRD